MPKSEDRLVKPRYEREPDGAAGAFYVVKGHCMLCALPVQVAPGNFSWSEMKLPNCADCPDHCRVERQPQTEEEIDRVVEAALCSEVCAIRYCGTDPAILAKFGGAHHLCDAIPEKKGLDEMNP